MVVKKEWGYKAVQRHTSTAAAVIGEKAHLNID